MEHKRFFLSEKKKLPVRAAFSWDDQFFYSAFEVQDAEHFQNNPDMRLWEQDSIQIALDVLNEKTSGKYGKHDFEFTIALRDGKTRVIPGVTPILEEVGQLAVDPRQIQAAVTHSSGKTVYECAFPWRTTLLRRTAPAEGEAIGLNFLVNNADRSASRSYVEWTEGIGSRKNPAAYHTLVASGTGKPVVYAETIVHTDSLLSLNAAIYNPSASPVKTYSIQYALKNYFDFVRKTELPSSGGIEFSLQIPLDRLPYGKMDFLFAVKDGGNTLLRRTSQQTRMPAEELVRQLGNAENSVRSKLKKLPEESAKNTTSWRSIVKAIAEFRLGWLEREKKRISGSLPVSFFQENTRDLQAIARELDTVISCKETSSIPRTDLAQVKISGGNFLQNETPVLLIGPNFDEKGSLASIRRSLDFVPRMGFNLIDLSDTLCLGWMANEKSLRSRRIDSRFEIYRTIASEKKLALGMNPALHYVSKDLYKDPALCGGQPLPDGKIWNGDYPAFRKLCGGHFMPFDLSSRATALLFDSFYNSFLDQWRTLDTFKFLWLTNEIDYYSNSKPYLENFRAELRKRYTSIEKLNRTWHTKYASFESIGRQKVSDPGYFDFMTFHRAEMTRFLTRLTQTVRSRERGLLISNKPQAFTILDPEKGIDFESQAKIFDIPGFDSGFASDTYRMNVDFNGMMAMDFLRSVTPEKPLANLEFHCLPQPGYENIQQTVHFQSFLHGVRMATFWLWVERCRSRDHEGCFLSSGERMLTGARIYFRLQKLSGVIAKFPAPRQVLLYYGDASLLKQPDYAESLKRSYQALLGMQLSIGFLTDSMLAENRGTEGDAVIIIPNAKYIRSDALANLSKLSGKKKMLILGDSFRFDPYGFPLKTPTFPKALRSKVPEGDYPEYRRIFADFLKQAGVKRLVEAEIVSGKNDSGIDSQSVRDGSGILCFLINMNNNPLTVRLRSGKKFTACHDLLSQKQEKVNPGNLTLGPGETRILKLQ